MGKAGKLLNVGQFLMTMAILFIVVSSTYGISMWLLVGVTGLVALVAATASLIIVASFPLGRR